MTELRDLALLELSPTLGSYILPPGAPKKLITVAARNPVEGSNHADHYFIGDFRPPVRREFLEMDRIVKV